MSNSDFITICLSVMVPLTAFFYKKSVQGQMGMLMFGITLFVTILLFISALVLWGIERRRNRSKTGEAGTKIGIIAGFISLILTLTILWGMGQFFPPTDGGDNSSKDSEEIVDIDDSKNEENENTAISKVSEENKTDSADEINDLANEDTKVPDDSESTAEKSNLYIAENRGAKYTWIHDRCYIADLSNVTVSSDGEKHLSLYYYKEKFETATLISSVSTDNDLSTDLSELFSDGGYYFFYVLEGLAGNAVESLDSSEYLHDKNTSTIAYYKKPEEILDTPVLKYDKAMRVIRWQKIKGARCYDVKVDVYGGSYHYSNRDDLTENEFSVERDITGLESGTTAEISIRAVSNDITSIANGDFSEPLQVIIP